ncbi:hypothetical protein B0T09DRAFT_21452 [Sordaria sp. MPI-SDFR-AT-0083]|nr:hypothetical protein B0T09DRAFT_21452 [Sordaria sp. MPI-SDFR-AT-0083]
MHSKPIGSRRDLATAIEYATGIWIAHLQNIGPCCVGTRLSWAAGRETTRPEDHAYSLLGLLDVQLPLLYGEGGERAFVRLQRELVRKYNDESILVWRDEAATPRWPPLWNDRDFVPCAAFRLSPILARSLRHFRHLSSLETGR